tara:strand:+ start:19878 stop:20084 length:207 start_codon:yes stop_codon:yes gene_type:complete
MKKKQSTDVTITMPFELAKELLNYHPSTAIYGIDGPGKYRHEKSISSNLSGVNKTYEVRFEEYVEESE